MADESDGAGDEGADRYLEGPAALGSTLRDGDITRRFDERCKLWLVTSVWSIRSRALVRGEPDLRREMMDCRDPSKTHRQARVSCQVDPTQACVPVCRGTGARTLSVARTRKGRVLWRQVRCYDTGELPRRYRARQSRETVSVATYEQNDAILVTN